MTKPSTLVPIMLGLVITLFIRCDQPNENTDNTLLRPWSGPFEGVPAFDQVKVEDVEEAMRSAMASHLEEIEAIANDKAPSTFDNTILAMESSGYELERAFAYYGVLSRNESTPEFRAIQKKLAPEFADYRSKIIQNEKLFKRIASIYKKATKDPF